MLHESSAPTVDMTLFSPHCSPNRPGPSSLPYGLEAGTGSSQRLANFECCLPQIYRQLWFERCGCPAHRVSTCAVDDEVIFWLQTKPLVKYPD